MKTIDIEKIEDEKRYRSKISVFLAAFAPSTLWMKEETRFFFYIAADCTLEMKSQASGIGYVWDWKRDL